MTHAATDAPSVSDPATDDTTVPEVDAPAADATPAEVTNLNDFWAAVDAIDPADPNYTDVTAEYEKLSRKGKMQASHGIKARTFQALDEDAYQKAKALSNASKALGSTTSTGEAADPTEELVNRMAGFFLAYKQLSAANANLGERVTAALTAADTDANSVASLLAKKLVETKMGRKPREGGGSRHSVGKHIAQVFADKPDGTTLTLKEISEAKSDEYGDDVAAVPSIQTHLASGKFDQPGLQVDTETVERDGETKSRVTGVTKVGTPDA